MMETEAVKGEVLTFESSDYEKELRLFKIREDLEPFFDVVSHQDLSVRCKLWKTGNCKYDGVNGVLKFNTDRGWYPFERHLVRVHKFSYENLIKGVSNEGLVAEGGTLPVPIAAPRRKRKRGREAFRTKCCVVCREFCLGSAQWEGSITELLENESTHLFPGSEGCTQLNQQLFYMYFLRKVVKFPTSKCEKYLKQCRGARMPETWFFLCSECKNLVSKAAELEEQIFVLQKKVTRIHDLVKKKTCGSVDRNTNAVLSDVATEVRKFILEPDISPPVARSSTKIVKPEVEETLLGEPSIENDDDWNASFQDDLNWESSVENSCTAVSQKSRRNRPSTSSRSHKRKKPLFVIEHEVVEDDCNEVLTNEEEVNESTRSLRIRRNIFLNENEVESGLQFDTIESCIKIDTDYPEPSAECLSEDDFTTETRALEIDNTEYPLPDSPTNDDDGDCDYVENEDDDHVSTSDDVSDESDSAPSSRKKSSKLTEGLIKKASESRPATVKRRLSNVGRLTTDDGDAETEYVCEICQSKYKNKKRFRDHQVAHEISKALGSRYECPQCSYPCTSEKARNIHISYRHGQNNFPCSLCSFVAPRKKQLTQHIRQHRNESQNDRVGEKFLCADFQYSETLKAHIKKVHPEAALGTQAGESGTKSESNASSSTAEYVCKHCGVQLSSQSCLSRHIKTHKELFGNKCELCGKSYATAQSLRRHKEINHTSNQVPCPYCDKTFPHKEYIRAHYKFCKLFPGRQELMGEPLEDSETSIPVGQPSQTLKLERETATNSSEQLKSERSQNVGHGTELVISPDTVDGSNIEFIQQTETTTEEMFAVQNAPGIIPPQFRLVVTTEGYQPITQHWTKEASE
ncbi:putative zinc finger protein [Orchesella cincta]|uniref:Putative zinc finger protein n=1 Tax=Orchesella cincta TaxID=48709 RepID=A0A1D2MYR1_ORCCI|nr:putative zinc finger protein [Orchesella cincta]